MIHRIFQITGHTQVWICMFEIPINFLHVRNGHHEGSFGLFPMDMALQTNLVSAQRKAKSYLDETVMSISMDFVPAFYGSLTIEL